MTNNTFDQPVGVVRELYRYPVKSMAAEALHAAPIGWHGLEGDRRYAFVQSDDRSGFPWLTMRELPQLWHYIPSFAAPDAPHTSAVQVRTPDGRALDIASAALAAELGQALGATVHLIKLDIGAFDGLALSLITTATLAALAATVGRELEVQRFRPNIVVEPLDSAPFAEDGWVDDLLVFGERPDSATMRANSRDQRCVAVNIDPSTLEKDPQVLRAIAQTRAACLGIYGSTERCGTIQVGDVVRRVSTRL